MKDKKSNQLSETSFRDNVAHSNGDLGLTSKFLFRKGIIESFL